MTKQTPLFVNERTAALLFDMKPREFRELVQSGHLPKPRAIGKHERWDVEILRSVANGRLALREDMEW